MGFFVKQFQIPVHILCIMRCKSRLNEKKKFHNKMIVNYNTQLYFKIEQLPLKAHITQSQNLLK